jgi:transcriptional regulator with XRE-family HTH domain
MTQRELSEKAHITFSYVSRLEAGGTSPGIDLLERLAQALGVEVLDLLPVSSSSGTASQREQVKGLFEAVVTRAGSETLAMLGVFLSRLAESPAINR